MIKQAKTAYNWRLLKPKKLGYIMVEMWSNPTCSYGNRHSAEQSTSEKPLLWGFKDPNNGFIYVGNTQEIWKLGMSHSYFNPTYGTGKEEPLHYLTQLTMPLPF